MKVINTFCSNGEQFSGALNCNSNFDGKGLIMLHNKTASVIYSRCMLVINFNCLSSLK